MSPETIVLLAEKALEIAISLIGRDEVRKRLDQASIDRAEAIADAAEVAKFGKEALSPQDL